MKKVKLLKDAFLEGRLLPPGKLVDVSDEVALVMIANGNASPVLAAAPEVKENAVSAEVQSADEQPEPAAVQAPEPEQKLGRGLK